MIESLQDRMTNVEYVEMAQDRRTSQKPIPDDLEKLLNSRQRDALHGIRYFGWKLRFVRRPLFQEPIFVVYKEKDRLIGILDPDGQINMGVGLNARSIESEDEQPPLQEHQPLEAAFWQEKRNGMAPIPGNLDELLSHTQLNALQKFEKSGWRLCFVRRPLFQEPVALILSPRGDRLAALELDGQIKPLPSAAIRKEVFVDD